ncbi:PQQ-dependent sugar dehydrogenase [Flavobacteriaceae bacterium XHP0103]|uniref:glucose/sorbosone family PQQ-dependent dehydrogenase n=1 Tax=Marixanthotalea marina TaxID=2844359 RepID=UPI002989CE7B|nr:glucose/sorbosone family PQQ-dependent dehydrogenase [Marixanthotalea marina]MBU3822832.1 PQQ-dependent sugar dehydrogenase [Marixanthotalea marina]
MLFLTLYPAVSLFAQGTLAVSGNGNPVNSGSLPTTTDINNLTDFGSVEIGSNKQNTFVLDNTGGNGNPNKLTNISVSLTGSSNFSLNTTSFGDLTGNGGTLNLIVTYEPSSDISESADITITFDNGLNDPYTFTIEGTGVAPTPEIDITDNSDTSINSGGNFDFGTVAPNSTPSEDFKIKNTSSTILTLEGTDPNFVTILGDSEFTITAQPSSNTIDGNDFETLTVTYSPTLAGESHSAILSIDNDDPDDGEDPYIINLSGSCDNITYTPITDGPDWTVSNLTPDYELNNPNTIVYGPDDNLWITERLGRQVVKVDPELGGSKTVMLDLTSVATATSGSQDGLMGMAVHPDLYDDINTSNNYVYLAYTYNSSGLKLRIERYTYNAGTGLLDNSSATTILEGFDASNDHNSGKLIFGPDMKLYYTVGDQGANQYNNSCDEIRAQYLPTSSGQTQTSTADKAEYKGKILRINLDGSIPADNPVLGGFRTHIYTYGHRNPQGIVFGSNGKLYSSEHGPKTDDELNIIEAGKNYGWPAIAGYYDNLAYQYCNWSSAGANCSPFSENGCPVGATSTSEFDSVNDAILPNFVEPIGTYNSTPSTDPTGGFFAWPTVAPSSIAIYEGGIIPGWGSSLLIPTLKRGTIFRAKLNATGDALESQVYEEFHSSNDRYRDVIAGPDGRTFYAITDSSGSTSGPSGTTPQTIQNPGVVIKIEYTGAAEPTTTTYYVDADSDNFGDSSDTGTEYASDPGAGFSLTNDDCDDTDPNLNPDTVWYLDADGDNYAVSTTTQCASPGVGYTTTVLPVTDCDDTDPNINPDTVWYLDADGDNYAISTTTQCASPGVGYTTTVLPLTDCDDTDENLNPDTVWYLDADGDNYATSTATQCTYPGTGYVLGALPLTDCDDTDPNINPDTVWYLDADGDNYAISTVTQCASPGVGYTTTVLPLTDCDDTDENLNPDTVWYLDADGDGFAISTATQCAYPGTGYVLGALPLTDCDDSDPNLNPDTVWYLDDDGDNYAVSTVTQCASPGVGYTTNVLPVTDCDDTDPNINPDTVWYLDADGDNYATSTATQCTYPGTGYVLGALPLTDCDDTDPNINPDTVWYLDADGDNYAISTVTQCASPGAGYTTNVLPVTDCDDSDSNINPDTVWYLDADGDGFAISTATQCTYPGTGYVLGALPLTDCDDTDPNINPDTVWYLDADGDNYAVSTVTQCASPGIGYTTTVLPLTDCDDSNINVNPGVSEIIGNGIDDDCNPSTSDGSLGIDDFNLSDVSISPNPFNHKITIKLPSGFNNITFGIQVYDLNGRLLLDKSYKSVNGTINLDHLNALQPAPYLIKIVDKDSGNASIKRLIKY